MGSRKCRSGKASKTEATSHQVAPSHPRGICNLRAHCPWDRGHDTRRGGGARSHDVPIELKGTVHSTQVEGEIEEFILDKSAKLRPEIIFKSVADHDDGARRWGTRREGTRGTMVVVGNKSKRPSPARRDHPSAIPDRSCPAPPRRPPPIVAVPFDGERGDGLIILIDAHLRRTTRLAPRNRTETANKVWGARLRSPAFGTYPPL